MQIYFIFQHIKESTTHEKNPYIISGHAFVGEDYILTVDIIIEGASIRP